MDPKANTKDVTYKIQHGIVSYDDSRGIESYGIRWDKVSSVSGQTYNIKKLQRALVKNGQIVKIGTTQFYSKEQQRMITMYILSTPVDFLGKAGVWKQMDYQIIRTASQLDLLNCLVDMWRALQEWQ